MTGESFSLDEVLAEFGPEGLELIRQDAENAPPFGPELTARLMTLLGTALAASPESAADAA